MKSSVLLMLMATTSPLPTVTKVVRLHEAQDAFCQSKALYRAFIGGRGSGKSWAGACDMIERAEPGRTYMVGSPTAVLMHDTTYPTFKELAETFGVWGTVRMSPYPTATLTTGATVRFRTAEDPEKMRGPNLSGIWLDEASLMAEEAYKISIACLREGGKQGWLSASMTPKGLLHWTYDVFGRQPPRPNTALFKSHTSKNPFLPPDFAATLAHQYAPALALQELGGEFIDLQGAEFPGEWFGPDKWVDAFPETLGLRVIFLDPAADGKKHGVTPKDPTAKPKTDYPCYVMLGRDQAGTLYVKADMERRPMTATVAVGLQLAREFQPLDAFGVEANGFQKLMADELARQSKGTGIMLPLHTVTNVTNKLVRIRRLTPYLSRGNIRFVDGPGTRLLVEQLRTFPLGDHDDGPDAMESAVRLAITLVNGRHKEARR
jgi:predicted phage terminase large subunit-like protein